MLEERRGSRLLDDFGGLMQSRPQLCALMSVAMFSSLGLPGLNGFIGEILIFKGSFGMVPVATAFASLGLLMTAAVFMRAMQELFSGPLAAGCAEMPGMSTAEKIGVIPATLLMIALGVAPQPMFRLFNATVAGMAELLS
jgi:NADH-quinone oxidoreductase subunit M